MNAQNNILWIIAESFYPEGNGTGYQLTSLAIELSKKYRIKVITTLPDTLLNEKKNLHEQYHEIYIHRIRVAYFDRNKLPFRIINIIIHSIKLFWVILKEMHRADKVLVVSNPPTLPFIVLMASKIIPVEVDLLLYDLYPEALAAVDVVSANSFSYKVLYFVSQWLFRKVHKIVVLGRDMQELLVRKQQCLQSKICLIPNWAETTLIIPHNIAQNIIL